MKPVNCINTIPIQQQYKIRRWYIFSLCSIMITVGVILFFLIPQLHTLYTQQQQITLLRKKTDSYDTLLTTQTALKKEHEEHEKRQAQINRYKDSPKSPSTYILSIVELCKKGISLEQIRKNSKNIEITLLCPSPAEATTLLNALSEMKEFNTIKLISLQRDTQSKKFRCVIKGTIAS